MDLFCLSDAMSSRRGGGELLEGSMDFDLLPDYFGKFDREFAEKLVIIEAFEEDTGLKVGYGDAENYEDKEGQDTIGKPEAGGDGDHKGR